MSTHTSKSSRRMFLSGAAAASAYVWIPKPVRGYTAAEMLATITIDNKVKPGTSKWELDTPALCVDLDKMEQNIAKMQSTLKANGLASRPHSKTHKCAAIAKYQLQTGSIGICCAKISEAEAMIENGVDKICMTTSNPSKSKIRRAMAIRKKSSNFIQAVDLEENARDLSAAAKEAGVVADVVIDVAVGTRSGIPAGDDVVALAKVIDKLPNLKLRGMLSYDGGVQHAKGFAARKERALKTIQPNAEVFAEMKKAGLNAEIFSGGGSGTYNIMHQAPGFTDVQVGSYLFMDMQYLAIGGQDDANIYTDFQPSLTVLVTVLNNRFPGLLTTDGGSKAFTLNKPNAGVIGEPGMDYNAGSDEFGSIKITGTPSKSYKIGDKLECIVPHCDPAVNEYDWIYGTRKDKVEVVWPITGRGRSQ
jgi:3-hydroxy-D-aspartate aldolase